MNGTDVKILFLNQMAGPLFRELAEDVAEALGPALLYTGHPHTAHRPGTKHLAIQPAPEYDRRSILRRLLSWLRYFVAASMVVARTNRTTLLFIVSNPPFLGLLGYLCKLIRGQRYVVLVYDVYPDILIALGAMGEGWGARIWRLLNRFVLERADAVIAISHDMADILEKQYDLNRTVPGKSVVIPNWADVETIRPLKKEDNWFALEHRQIGKTTVLYSGNMGNTHDIESILEVARLLRHERHIHFLLIGEGAKWSLVERAIADEGLENITLLPFQPEEILPWSMTTGDIGIVPYHPGSEGCIVPSKTYYYLAAGVVPMIVAARETDLTKMVVECQCGMAFASGDRDAMARAILELDKNPARLTQFKVAARATAEKLYSRRNTEQFVSLLGKCMHDDTISVKNTA